MLKVATFNVSMEATNYKALGMKPSDQVLQHVLSTGEHSQVKNIAEIIQRVNPDILMLNEFDYIADKRKGVDAFVKNYLNVSQGGLEPVDYPYTYVATVNTGEPTKFDLDNNGKAEGFGGDAYGFGLYPGQYGMALLSKYPIDVDGIRTFQTFKWHHMPHPQVPIIPDESGSTDKGKPWYDVEEWAALRLSSKSHWDVPVKVGGKTVHILAMHPTPPNFDGSEDRNGKRNHDEIALWRHLLDGQLGAAPEGPFVLLGDANLDPQDSDGRHAAMREILSDPWLQDPEPASAGGRALANADQHDLTTADVVMPLTAVAEWHAT